MTNIKEFYDTAKQYVLKQIAKVALPLTLMFPSKSNLEEVTVLLNDKYRPVRFPDDPEDPEYQRQQEINRFHGLRDMELQMGLYD